MKTVDKILKKFYTSIDYGNKHQEIKPKTQPAELTDLVKDVVMLLKHYEFHFRSLDTCDEIKLIQNSSRLVFSLLNKSGFELNKWDVIVLTMLVFQNYNSESEGSVTQIPFPKENGWGLTQQGIFFGNCGIHMGQLTGDDGFEQDCFENKFAPLSLDDSKWNTIWLDIEKTF